jgi:hypothetical protein
LKPAILGWFKAKNGQRYQQMINEILASPYKLMWLGYIFKYLFVLPRLPKKIKV